MKVIFLDIDGVLNTITHLIRSDKHHGYEFNPTSVTNLKEILKETKAKIVVISSWKRHKTISYLKEKIFKHYHLSSYIIGKTPDLMLSTRADEINTYICKNKIDIFIILDDDEVEGELREYQVLIDNKEGINEEVKIRSIDMLTKKES